MSQDKLQGLIRYLVSRAPRQRLNRTQLVKLVFMVDRLHYEAFGQTLTGLRYEYWEQGPFTWDIPNTAEELPQINHTYHPPGFRHPYPEHDYVYTGDDGDDGSLSPVEHGVADNILAAWGKTPASRLVHELHEDPFVKQFEGGLEIDFSRLDDDPLADPDVQDAVMADVDLYESMRRAEKEACAARR